MIVVEVRCPAGRPGAAKTLTMAAKKPNARSCIGDDEITSVVV